MVSKFEWAEESSQWILYTKINLKYMRYCIEGSVSQMGKSSRNRMVSGRMSIGRSDMERTG